MQCPKCGSNNFEVISKTKGKIKKRGFIMTLVHLFLIVGTCGLWLIVPLLRGGSKGKIKSETRFVCKECGNEFNAKQGNKAIARV